MFNIDLNPFPTYIMDEDNGEDENMMHAEPKSNEITQGNYNNIDTADNSHNDCLPSNPLQQNYPQHRSVLNFNQDPSQGCAKSDASFHFIARKPSPSHSYSTSSYSNKRSYSHVQNQDEDENMVTCSQAQDQSQNYDADGDLSSMSDNDHLQRIKRLRIHEGISFHQIRDRNESNFASTSSTHSMAALHHGHNITSLPVRSARLSLKRPHSFLSVDVNVPVGSNARSTLHNDSNTMDGELEIGEGHLDGSLQFERLSTVSIDDLEIACSTDGGGIGNISSNAKNASTTGAGTRYETFNNILGNLHLERERRARVNGGKTRGQTQVQVPFNANNGSMSSLSTTTTSANNGNDIASGGTINEISASIRQRQNDSSGNSFYNANGCHGNRGIPRKVRLQSNSNLG